MAFPSPVESDSNPFEISVNVIEDPMAFTMAETSVIADQYIVFHVQMSTTAGGSSSSGSSDSGGDDGGVTPAPLPEWSVKSLVVEELTPTGLSYDAKTYTFSGKYASVLFGKAEIKYLKADMQTIVTVNSWDDVPDRNDPDFFSVIHFQDSLVRNTIARFKATAVLEVDELGEKREETMTQEFTQEVTNDWTSGHLALVASVNGE